MNIKKLLRPIFSRFVSRSEFDALSGSFQEHIGRLANEFRQDDLMYAGRVRQELDNVIDMLRQENQNLRQELANSVEMLRQEDRNLNYDTYTRLLQEAQKHIDEIGMNLISTIMQSRLTLARRDFNNNSRPPIANSGFNLKAEPFDIYLDKFKKLHPHLFETWASANFGVNLKEYKENPATSCAVASRENVRLFRGFTAPYLKGRILDVGCGPYSMPYYLLEYPVELISGIDPIEPYESHPFEFVQGFAEFLPWKDSTFDVLIAATSLDHVLSLDLAFQEIRRVLKPRGKLLVWDWFGENTEPYNPSTKTPELIDRYHLFNFSEDWFEERMTKHFSIEEKIRLYGNWSHDRFYALRIEVK